MSTVIGPNIEALEADADKLWHETYDPKKEKTPEEEALEKEKLEKERLEKEKKPEDVKPEGKPKEELKPEDYKHKYDVLQGKYDAEVPRLAMDLAEANKKLIDLEKKVSEIPKPEPKKEEPKPLSPTLEKLKTEYPDIFEGSKELTQTMIQEALDNWSKKMTEKTEKVDKKVDKVEEKVEKSDRERFEESIRLDTEVGSKIDTINNDPRFLEWLKEPDEYTGLPKSVLATDAIKRMDKTTTLKFFKNFKKEKMAPPVKEEPIEGEPKDKPAEKKPKLLDIAPPRGGGSGVTSTDDKNVITIEDYNKFLDDVNKGKWKGKEAEAEAEDRRLHAAVFKRKPKT